MKKILIIIAAVSVFSVTITSCKSSAKCPAYGKISTETTTTRV